MKDYSMNKEERDNFILSYDIEGNNIIVNFANGFRWTLPYNDKNERIVLEEMRKQVESTDKLHKGCKSELERLSRLFKTSIYAFLGITGFIVLGGIFSNVNVCIAGTVFAIPFGFSTIFSGISYLNNKSLLNDLEKNRRYLKIEDKLNENIRKTNENVLVNTSKTMKQFVENAPENKPVFNINSFNYVPYSDIEQVMDNIKRNEEFGFDYSDTLVKEQGKTRKRKR